MCKIENTKRRKQLENFFNNGGVYKKEWNILQDKGVPQGAVINDVTVKFESQYDADTGHLCAVKAIEHVNGDTIFFSIFNVNGSVSYVSTVNCDVLHGKWYFIQDSDHNNCDTIRSSVKGYTKTEGKYSTTTCEIIKSQGGDIIFANSYKQITKNTIAIVTTASLTAVSNTC